MPGENTPENSISTGKPEVGPCRLVFETQEEIREFFRDFNEVNAPTLQLFAEARREGERRVWRGDL